MDDSPRRWSRQRPLLLAIAGLMGLVVVAAGGCMERLFFHPTRGPTPPPARFVGASRVSFASGDGTRLTGWFIPTQTGSLEAAPTILHVHGNAGNITNHIWFTEHLPRSGFNLFLFDYRGYGESAGTPQRREQLIGDTHSALDAVLARPGVDPERVGMFAQSLGGGIGLAVMAERPEIRCAVIVSAFASWRDIAADAVSPVADPGPIAASLARLCIRDHGRPIDAIATIDRPLLLLHGDADSIVPVEHGRRLAAAASEATLVVLPGGRHNDLRATHPEIDGMVEDFFREQLPPVSR